jgi:plastocyanin
MTGASAATVSVVVTDAGGRPAADAVISLTPTDKAQIAVHAPEKSIIAQRDEMFVPLVVIVRRGGEVVFTNNDTTMHQVYSFSPVKQFQFEIDRGQVSKPVVFDKPGVAAIGCNIHDQMIAYVYVADAPFAVLTGADGRAELRDVPPGSYRASLWHPQLPPGRPWPTSALTVSGAAAKLAFAVPLLAANPHGMKHMHMDY